MTNNQTKKSKKRKRKKEYEQHTLDEAYPINQKKKKKKRRGNVKIKAQIRATYRQSPCANAHGHFHPLNSFIFSLQFSLHFGEKTFWLAWRKNTWAPSFIFLLLHPIKHTSKKSPFPFSLQNFSSILFHLQTNTP